MWNLIHTSIGEESNCRILVSGTKGCGKSSLAFQLAYDAADQLEYVVYICNKLKIENSLPKFIVHANSLGQSFFSEILSNIRMKYVKDLSDLSQVLFSLHLLEDITSVSSITIVIDDLHDIFLNENETTFDIHRSESTSRAFNIKDKLAILGLILDTIESLQSMLDDQFPCEFPKIKLIVVESQVDRSMMNVYSRLFTHAITIEKLHTRPFVNNVSICNMNNYNAMDGRQVNNVNKLPLFELIFNETTNEFDLNIPII